MNRLFKYIFISLASIALFSNVASAQFTDDQKKAIVVDKKAIGPADDGSYKLVLSSFITGEADSRITTTYSPASDIVLVLDVSGSMDMPMSGTPTRTSDNLATIYSNTQNGTKTYYYNNDGTYYKLHVTKSGNSYKGRYYNGSQNNYFVDIDLTNSTKIYEGEQARIDALKASTKAFINIIAENTTDKIQNKISIVKFAGGNSQSRTTNDIGNDFYTSSGYYSNKTQKVTDHLLATNGALITAVDGLIASGATYTNAGLTHAKNILTAQTRNSKKVVILFTDGSPSDSKLDINRTANELKNAGVTVYTIGAFESADNATKNYLRYTSSNYTNVKYSGSTYSGTESEKQGYSIIASNVNALEDAFKKAAEESKPENTGGEGIPLETEKVTIKDIVTSHFVVPEGTSSVTLKMVPVTVPTTKIDKSYTIQFDEANAKTLTKDEDGVYAEITKEDGKSNVNVKGFDFAGHWVGFEVSYKDDEETGRVVHPEGAKLVIEIIVAPDPDDDGGEVTTNDPKSGLYYEGETDPLVKYDVPSPVYVPLDLKIVKKNLPVGETAMFKVYQGEGDSKVYLMTIAITSTGSTSSQTVAKLPIKDKSGNPITYSVEEDTTWSYRFESIAPSVTSKSLYTDKDGKFEANSTFEFDTKVVYGTKEEGVTDQTNYGFGAQFHDEKSQNNVFGNSVSAKSGAQNK